MTRFPYRKPWRLRLLFWLITVFTLGLFFTAAYWESVTGYGWLTMVTGLSIVVLIGLLNALLRKPLASILTCPQCGGAPLRESEDEQGRQLLVCDNCAIEWETGVSNDPTS